MLSKSLHFLAFFLIGQGQKSFGVDQNDVFPDTDDLIPGDDDAPLRAESEKTALHGYDDGGKLSVANVELHLADASKLFPFTNVDDLLFSEILTVAFLHVTHLLAYNFSYYTERWQHLWLKFTFRAFFFEKSVIQC